MFWINIKERGYLKFCITGNGIASAVLNSGKVYKSGMDVIRLSLRKDLVLNGGIIITVSQFRKAISLGLGSAIIELKKNRADNEKFCKAVLFACINDTGYDSQIEDSRQHYLYEAIELIGNKKYFLEAIINRINTADSYRLIEHLCGILYMFWEDGFKTAGEAIQDKFDDYISKIVRMRKMDRRRLPPDTLTLLALWLCDIYGIKGFWYCAEKIGQALDKYPDKEIVTLEWLISSTEYKFGNSISARLEKKGNKSDAIRVFYERWSQEVKIKTHNTPQKTSEITIDEVLSLAKTENKYKLYRLAAVGMKLFNSENISMAWSIANELDKTDDIIVKTSLMRIFSRCDYPLSIDHLLSIYENSDGELKVRVLEALSRFRDERIHDIAVINLESGQFIYESMKLLIKNFKNDYKLILETQRAFENKRDIYHGITMAIMDVFKTKRAGNALEILLHAYHNNCCSYCRTYIVEIMCKSKIIPNEILKECLFDCALVTRKIAKKYESKLPSQENHILT